MGDIKEREGISGEKSFEYTYSAKQQAEIEQIRKKYLPKEESKMEQLRKLDRDVTKPGTIWSLVLGIAGALIFGGGMACVLEFAGTLLIPGIVLGLAGILILSAAYPVYRKITERQKEKIAPRILALTEELLK